MAIFSIISGIKSARTFISKSIQCQKDINLRQIYILKKILVLINLVLYYKEDKSIMWKQGNGTLICVADMTTEHVKASLRLLKEGYIYFGQNDIYVKFYWEEVFFAELHHRKNSP